MANVNMVVLIGNLTRDPEMSYTPKGTAACEISLAVNHKYTTEAGEKREEVTFVEVQLWGRTAEIAGEYLKKGNQAFVEGRLKLDQWDDKTTGQKRSKLRVVCQNLQLLGNKPPGEGGGRKHDDAPEQPQRKAPAAQQRPAPGTESLEQDDVPF